MCGISYNIPHIESEESMDKLDYGTLITQLTNSETFYITWYAKKHSKIITRHGTWTKPNTDIQGKHFVSNEGKHCFVYWDLDATPNDNGNQWRMATDPMRVRL